MSVQLPLSSHFGECPVQLHPSSLVVRYGGSASANCTVSEGHLGVGWEASQGSVDMVQDVQLITWRVENLTKWHIEPKCFVNFMNGTDFDQCIEALQVTLYKTPDSVSISSVDHTGPMVEGRQYQLQCEVQNIAPVQSLTVKWYRGEILESESSFNNSSKTPMNVSSTLTITPSRADDGAQYSCVAELELGPEGPQPPPEVKSEPLKITVHYGPSIETIPSPHPVIRGYSVELICNASGHPPPEVEWWRDGQAVGEEGGKLVISNAKEEHAGEYTCVARNSAWNTSAVVQVELKENYLPIIAGLVALVVVVISIVFIFIYSIYYKNTKMGHYSLKSCKLSGQNGNVAQNGRDSNLPMKKLTQPNVYA
ncbi:hemicentin-2-like [Megalops cyprinoides]|uniref:hemicentin-2-like n=1 Tax=Megalops cyprinoides TaxID=118141 RepID=UPI0018654353|nr:hemicentin-2-like [Megalops cyprinoides]